MNTRRARRPDWVWVVLILAALAAVTLAVAGYSAATRDWKFTSPAARTLGREEFRALLLDKTPDEVRALVGAPDSTSDTTLGVYWYYKGRTRDPVTGNTDSRAQVAFRDGRVRAVNY
jgi:hypothetical protein